MLRLVPLLASALGTDFGAVLRRGRRSALICLLAGVLLLGTYAAVLAAVGLYLSTLLGAVNAALAIAAAQLAIAALLVAALSLVNSLERRRERKREGSQALLATLALSVLPSLTRSRAGLGLAVAGGLALLLAARNRDHD
ncbi:hypothetical protein [Stappia sp. MMSF_3263]|uniref:hypothetical protein n=1 Tax=Stappia sp. MMSF_3263 TaxID=3046693 RepID=UPI00273F0C7B|nr:hypothetical protein [Stappia sp. MMSF_3263]